MWRSSGGVFLRGCVVHERHQRSLREDGGGATLKERRRGRNGGVFSWAGGEPKPFTHFLGFSDFSFCLISFFGLFGAPGLMVGDDLEVDPRRSGLKVSFCLFVFLQRRKSWKSIVIHTVPQRCTNATIQKRSWAGGGSGRRASHSSLHP